MNATLKWAETLRKCYYAMGNCYGMKCKEPALIKAVKAGHLSLLEHAGVTFDIICSQKCLAQITRHRHFSFTVQSTRGMNITGNGFYNSFDKLSGVEKTKMKMAYGAIAMQFENLLASGVPVEIASYVLPLGTNVKLTVTGNLRCWFEYLKKRVCNRASDEHRKLAIEIYNQLNAQYPTLFNQEVLGICVGCKEVSCDFSVHKATAKNPIIKELNNGTGV